MQLDFVKYQGTGNDFILVDDRTWQFPQDDFDAVAALCHRRFGIGADGLILLQESDVAGDAFRMVYYNSDGRPSTFCGNGGRCIVAFAAELGLVKTGNLVQFTAADGLHEAVYHGPDRVELRMRASGPAASVNVGDGLEVAFLNTGSPHLIIPVTGIDGLDVDRDGAPYRYDPQFAEGGGTNVNFVERVGENSLRVRTYERGVEGETYSCGTGVTAAALWAAPGHTVSVETPGGKLQVRSSSDLSEVWLIGPAVRVYAGQVPLRA